MRKTIDNSAFYYGDLGRLAALIPVAQTGVDRTWLRKRAADAGGDDLADILADVRPIAGRSTIHLVAMVAGETGGPNKNADWFGRQDLIEKHPTFVSNAKVYKEHLSDDPSLASGDVLKSIYNPKMDRVELVISVDNDKWSKELSSLEDGNDLKFSMSCTLPYDQCRVCGNRARRRSEYCDCMRKMPGKILDDGRIVCVENPNPTFYDISGVRRPADAVAFIMQKAASAGVVTGAELYELSRRSLGGQPLSRFYMDKLAAYDKLATIEKTVELTAPGDPTGFADTVESSGLSTEEQDALADFGQAEPGKLLGALARYKIVLPISDFVRILLRVRQADELAIKIQLPGLLSSCDGEDLAEDRKYDEEDPGDLPETVKSAMERLASHVGYADEQIFARKMRAVAGRKSASLITPFWLPKSATVANQQARLQAVEYASYLISCGRGLSDLGKNVVIAQNYSR